MYYVITFPTTHMALKFEQKIKQKGIKTKLIPIPRKLDSNCGLCGQIQTQEELHCALQSCREEKIEVASVYIVPSDSKKTPKEIRGTLPHI